MSTTATPGANRRSTPAAPPSSPILRLWHTAVGKKIVVAVTGLILAIYVVLHVVGNLTVFLGPGDGDAQIDAWGEFLRRAGEPLLPHAFLLWAIRVLLVAALVIHIYAIVKLTQQNSAAQPDGHKQQRIGRSLSSRTMRWTGGILLAFIVFHLLQFTLVAIQPDRLTEGAVYANLYAVFGQWWMALIYVAAMGLLFLHLRHGLWSLMQTMGWDSRSRNRTLRTGATVLTALVVLGFVSIPVLLYAGALPAPSGASTPTAQQSSR